MKPVFFWDETYRQLYSDIIDGNIIDSEIGDSEIDDSDIIGNDIDDSNDDSASNINASARMYGGMPVTLMTRIMTAQATSMATGSTWWPAGNHCATSVPLMSHLGRHH